MMARVRRLVLVVVSVLACGYASYDWLQRVAVTFEALDTIHAIEQSDTELAEIANQVDDRIRLKMQLIEDLMDQKRSFRDVIHDFRQMNESNPSIMIILESHHPHCETDELIARNVLDYARGYVETNSNTVERYSQLIREFTSLYPHAEPPACPR